MKKLLFLLFILFSIAARAQNYPDFGLNKIRIADSDRTIEAEIYPSGGPSAKANLFYYWYSANLIHTTQGGYSGDLLNGHYNEYYPNKNLKEQGTFKKGLKNGVWKTWNKNGTINHVENWKNGIRVTDEQASIWQRLKIFKRHQSLPADTVKKIK